MVEVHLHGPLAKNFGRVWNLDIQHITEAVQAINVNRPGFKKFIMDLDRKGLVFRVRSKTHDYDDQDVGTTLGSVQRIDIIPIVRGASAGLRFVVGAVMVGIVAYASIVSGGTLTVFGQGMLSVGLGLMFGAVTEWLTPKVKKPDDQKSLNSWTFSGPTNTVDQGQPIPVIYGEVLTGGYTVSAGISASQLTASGATGPAVNIGGDVNPIAATGGGGNQTVIVRLSAASFNMAEPYTYSWTKSGFASASAIRVKNANTATVQIELDYVALAGNGRLVDNGTVTITMTGKKVDSSGDTVSVNSSTPVKVTVDTTVYEPTGGG